MLIQVLADRTAAAGRPLAADRMWLVAVALLLAALAVRLALFIGYQGHDDRSYISFAWFFAHGGDIAAQQLADPWIGRIWAWVPTSLFIRLFGASEFVLVLNSLLASLASVLVAFVAGRHFFGIAAGVLAAVMMVFLPIDVLYGTRAFGDQATGFWCASTLLCFLVALSTRSTRWALATGLCWGVSYLSKETAVLMALPFALILLVQRVLPWRSLALIGAGLAAVVCLELAFWSINTGDPLYRWHATLGSRDAFVPPPKVVLSWIDLIPSPIPNEVFRSPNTLLDALLMVTTNDEWGLLFYFALPLALLSLVRGSTPERALSIFLLSMLLLLLFLPLHFPHYTLGRDPRHFTMLNIPAVLLVAAWLARLPWSWRGSALAGLLLTWAVCLLVGYISSDVSTQRQLAAYLSTPSGERVWTNNLVASDAIVLSGFNPGLNIGIVRMRAGRVVDAEGHKPSNPNRALRFGLPVAERVEDLRGQLVALPEGVSPEPGWSLDRVFAPRPSKVADAMRRAALALGIPQRIAYKIAPSHGMTIRLYRAQ